MYTRLRTTEISALFSMRIILREIFDCLLQNGIGLFHWLPQSSVQWAFLLCFISRSAAEMRPSVGREDPFQLQTTLVNSALRTSEMPGIQCQKGAVGAATLMATSRRTSFHSGCGGRRAKTLLSLGTNIDLHSPGRGAMPTNAPVFK